MTASEPTLQFETLDEYCLIALRQGITDAAWTRMEADGNRVVEHLAKANGPKVLVDLSEMDYISSAVVALLVRFWKTVQARDGQMVVVNTHPIVGEVLKIAGLLKIWTVVGSREQGIHELGLSRKAKVQRRESRVLIVAAVLTAVLAAAGLVAKFVRPELFEPTAWMVLIYGGGGAAVLLGAVSAARQSGWLRGLAVLVVLIGLGVIATDLTVRPLRIAPAQPAAGARVPPRDGWPRAVT